METDKIEVKRKAALVKEMNQFKDRNEAKKKADIALDPKNKKSILKEYNVRKNDFKKQINKKYRDEKTEIENLSFSRSTAEGLRVS